MVEQYVAKGGQRKEQSVGILAEYAWWDGFQNCAENILQELKEHLS